jgi:hypothetical protein
VHGGVLPLPRVVERGGDGIVIATWSRRAWVEPVNGGLEQALRRGGWHLFMKVTSFEG